MENKIMEMVNEEVVTDVVDVVAEKTGKSFVEVLKKGAKVVAFVGGVWAIYKVGKFAVETIGTSVKAKKAEKAIVEGVEYTEVDQTKVDSEEETE